MSFWNVLKVASSFIVLGYLSIALATGLIIFVSTGQLKPLLDNTLGIIIAPDERAYSAVQELIDVKAHERNPEKYTNEYLLYLRHQIVLDLAIAFLVIYGLYRLFSFFSGIHEGDPSTRIMIIGFAILSYFTLGAIYQVLMYIFFKTPGQNLLFDVIPMKGLVSSIFHAPTVFSVQAPAILSNGANGVLVSANGSAVGVSGTVVAVNGSVVTVPGTLVTINGTVV